jgi:hypothetical protein|nr:MAG: hypothetical protein [Lake Baikal virophage 15]
MDKENVSYGTAYYRAHKTYLDQRRVLCNHAKGFPKDYIVSLEKEHGLTGAINHLKSLKKLARKNAMDQIILSIK